MNKQQKIRESASQKKYYLKNRKKIIARQKKYNKAHRNDDVSIEKNRLHCEKYNRKMKYSIKLLKYAKQGRYDMYDRRDGHEEIHELFKSLTLRSGNRVFRLKDVDYFEFSTFHVMRGSRTNHISIYFKVQKKASSRKFWENRVLNFVLHISYRKLSVLRKEDWSGYKAPVEVRKGCATILSKDFKFNSTINLSTKDVCEKGEILW